MTTHSSTPERFDHHGCRYAVLYAAIAGALSCSSPTLPADSNDSPLAVASIQVSGPSTMVVNERSLLGVSVTNARGQTYRPTSPVSYASSDPQVLVVSNYGVLHGLSRGTATISVTVDSVTTRLAVAVKVRVQLSPAYVYPVDRYVLNLGDSLQLVARYVDFNGAAIDESPAVVWSSSSPALASVDSEGLVHAVAADGHITITASTADGTVDRVVEVLPYSADRTGSIRFAHAVPGAGPITFISNRLAPVTLTYGQWADFPVQAGYYHVRADGMPASTPSDAGKVELDGYIEPERMLSLYATAWRSMSFLTAAWNPVHQVRADSGLVRLIQGGDLAVAYLLPTGAAREFPNLCYFDPGDQSPYYVLPAGAFDLVLQEKITGYFVPDTPYKRFPTSIDGGHAITLVLTGTSARNAGYVAFPDR